MKHLFDVVKREQLQFSSTVSDLLKCTICKNILIDSSFAPCGCKFCLNCIMKYLLNGCKPCPSGKKECEDVILDLKTDITKDSASDALISNLVVVCPHDSCDHQCRLRAIADHVLICSYRPIDCEFNFVGCVEKVKDENGMVNHLTTGNVSHMRLLMGFLSRIESEMRQRIDAVELRLEQAVELKERKDREWQTEKNELLTSMCEMKAEMAEMKAVEQHTTNEIQRMIQTNEELEKKIQCQNKTIEEMEKKIKDSGEIEGKKLREEIKRKFKENCEDLTKKLEPLEKKMKESGDMAAEALRQEMTDKLKSSQKEQMKKMQQSQDNMKVEHCQESKALEQKLLQVIQRVQDEVLNNEFVWKVEGMTDKRREAAAGRNEIIYSEYFYSHRNGYRIRLSMYPNGNSVGKGTHLSLCFFICKGPFDNVLKWPMKKKIRLAIVNRRGQEHICYVFSYEKNKDSHADNYQKPTDDNKGLGLPQFIKWDKLQENSDVLTNDVLFFRCSFVD